MVNQAFTHRISYQILISGSKRLLQQIRETFDRRLTGGWHGGSGHSIQLDIGCVQKATVSARSEGPQRVPPGLRRVLNAWGGSGAYELRPCLLSNSSNRLISSWDRSIVSWLRLICSIRNARSRRISSKRSF